jgi:hypothetical protein
VNHGCWHIFPSGRYSTTALTPAACRADDRHQLEHGPLPCRKPVQLLVKPPRGGLAVDSLV